MGIKALVDFSLIRELCEGIPVKESKREFKAKLKSKKDDRPPNPFKKVDEIKRILVPDSEKERKPEGKLKKSERKRKRKKEPEKPTKNTFSLGGSSPSSGTSESDTSSNSDTGTSESDNDAEKREDEKLERAA